MRRSRKSILALAFAGLLGGTAAAPAAPTSAAGFTTVASDAAGAPHGDGGRWVVYAPARDTVRVLDDESGERWSERIPCATAPYGDPVLAVGGGQAVVGCDRAGSGAAGWRPLLLDLTTRSWSEVAGFEALAARLTSNGSGVTLDFPAVGSRWLHVVASEYRSRWDVWIDWRTGALGPEPTAATATDLDAPELNVPLCAPLRRAPSDDAEDRLLSLPPFAELLTDGPLAVTVGPRTPLALLRCGSAARLRLEPHARPSLPSQLAFGSGAVSWQTGEQGRLYQPRCGVRLSWTVRTPGVTHSSGAFYRVDGSAIERLALPRCAAISGAPGIRLRSGGRTVAAQLTHGTWPSLAESTALSLRAPTAPPPRLRLARGARIAAVALRSAVPLDTVRWRTGDGAWRAAPRASGGRWLLRPARGGSLTLALRTVEGLRFEARATLRG